MRYENDLMAELGAQFPRTAKAIIGTDPAADLSFDTGLPDVWNAVLYVMVAQLLAVHWANLLDINVDDPFEGQATLTRVVSDVALYFIGKTNA